MLKMKRMIKLTVFLCVLVFLMVENAANTEAKGMSYKNVTAAKNQIVTINLEENDCLDSEEFIWKVENRNLKIISSSGNKCVIKTRRVGQTNVYCFAGQTKYICRINITQKDEWCGNYKKNGYFLDIIKSGSYYYASCGIEQLFSIDRMKGRAKKGILTLHGKTYGGENCVIKVKRKQGQMLIKVKKGTTGELKTGTKIVLQKYLAKNYQHELKCMLRIAICDKEPAF